MYIQVNKGNNKKNNSWCNNLGSIFLTSSSLISSPCHLRGGPNPTRAVLGNGTGGDSPAALWHQFSDIFFWGTKNGLHLKCIGMDLMI